jgi:hypothetical protein
MSRRPIGSPARHGGLGRAVAAAALAACLLPAVSQLGCDDPPRRPPPPDTRPAEPAEKPFEPIDFAALAPTDPTPARPGHAVGRILGPDGKPLRAPGVRIEVTVAGVREDAQTVNLKFEAKPDGTYVRKLDNGTYTSVAARIEFPFDDHTYRLPLVPVNGSDPRQDAAVGVVQDFAWKLTGLRPGARPEAERADPWLGGSIHASYVSVNRAEHRAVRSAPQGSVVRFTLTPTGPLADGRRGDPVLVARRYEASGTGLDRPLLTDLPLAKFALTGVEERPDGSRGPLMFLQSDGQTWAESVEGTFPPDLARAALEPQMIHFTRQDR